MPQFGTKKSDLKKVKLIVLGLVAIVFVGLLIPQNLQMPVKGATESDYNPESFWYYPWGKSVTHKGVDIFAKKGTEVASSTLGVVLYAGNYGMGGNFVVILGPKWRLHYYAHLDQIKATSFSLVDHQTIIGTVGTSGNAAGKSPHLHYSIGTTIPYVWRMDSDHQGWKKMFYLNPIDYLEK